MRTVSGWNKAALKVGLTVASLGLLVAGCGSNASTPETHMMPDGTRMSGSSMSEQMAGDAAKANEPSHTASMICGDEIREAVARTMDLKAAPAGVHQWSDRLYRCSYPLDAGELRLSVKDLDTGPAGDAYFHDLRGRLPGATTITGMANFGFPAFETPHGDVVFIKDHKTLWVDASRLASSKLPAGMSREGVAYGVAAAVIGCWTE